MLKMKAKAMGNKSGKVLFDIDAGQDTFITGGGVPGKKKHDETDEIPEKIYDNEEDQLLDNVDKMEEDMKEMMRYLNEVENMMSGDDLSQIKRMMKCTDQSVDQHVAHYDLVKAQVDELNKGAMNAMKKIGRHNTDVARMVMDS